MSSALDGGWQQFPDCVAPALATLWPQEHVFSFVAASVNVCSEALFTVTKNQSIGDINQIYAMTERDGAEFRLASIPASFTAQSAQPFDPVYMKALFEVGYRLGQQGNAWTRTPPDAVLLARR